MPAFVLIDSNIHDLETYRTAQPPGLRALDAVGGRFIARGRQPTILEGGWTPTRLSLVEFADLDTAQRWYDSADYQAAKVIRERAADVCMVAFDAE
jgi:uncharacterized protein (DUF1330 family)